MKNETLKTHPSLLHDLHANTNPQRWGEFIAMYSPLIGYYLRKTGVSMADVDDLRQEVLIVLVRRLPHWEYDPARGRFRGYVKTITANMARRYFGRASRQPKAVGGTVHQAMMDLHGHAGTPMEDVFDQAWRWRVFEIACERVKQQVDETTWAVFERVAIKNQPAGEVAEGFGMKVGNVYVIRSRVLAKLRAEVELLDE